MIKRAILLVTVSLSLSACGGKDTTENVEVSRMENNIPTTTESHTKKKKYEIITETYEDKNVVVEYPRLTGLTDKEKQDEINHSIKKEALNPYLETIMQLESDQIYEAEGEYEIKQANEQILSIVYKSYNNVTPSAHPFNRLFTTNLDLQTGELLFLPDFVEEIDEAFIQKLKTATYVGDLEEEYIEQIRDMAFSWYENDDALIEALENSEDRKYGIYVYITEDTLGISLPVPHVAGDHVEFEIPLLDLVKT